MSDSIRLARDCSQVSPPGSPMKMGPSVRVPFSLVACSHKSKTRQNPHKTRGSMDHNLGRPHIPERVATHSTSITEVSRSPLWNCHTAASNA